jgi:competence protein ComEA
LPDGRLILNEATAEDLDRLPGIGRKRAEDIIQLRGRVGRFRRLTDLLRVRGIGVKSLGKLKEHLLLDRPVEATSEKTPATDVKAQQSAKPEQPVGPASTSQSVGSPL